MANVDKLNVSIVQDDTKLFHHNYLRIDYHEYVGLSHFEIFIIWSWDLKDRGVWDSIH